jgi:hypothetical protein
MQSTEDKEMKNVMSQNKYSIKGSGKVHIIMNSHYDL